MGVACSTFSALIGCCRRRLKVFDRKKNARQIRVDYNRHVVVYVIDDDKMSLRIRGKRRNCESESTPDLTIGWTTDGFKRPWDWVPRKRRTGVDASDDQNDGDRKWTTKKKTPNATTFGRRLMKVGESLQRTWSGAKLSSPSTSEHDWRSTSAPTSPVRGGLAVTGGGNRTDPRQRGGSRTWTESLGVGVGAGPRRLSDREVQRQEAIFELYRGEEDILEDLRLVKTAYYDPLRQLNIMTPAELRDTFGSVHNLAHLHQDLLDGLNAARGPDGTTAEVGATLVRWVPSLNEYVAYCANQVHAKALLDEKKSDKRLEDFLQRCLESPFSRKLDLWNFLDVPRSRLVKYPLLFRNILKLTSQEHPDHVRLPRAIAMIEDIIREVDEQTGKAECRLYLGKLDYIEDKQRDACIDEAKVLLCSGVLKNTRGTKLNVFLFDRALVLTRPATREHGLVYQVYRQPIPNQQLAVEDLKDGEVKLGSFRSAFSHSHAAKNLLRVSFRNPSLGQAHTLQANDEHDKKQWLQSLRKVGVEVSSLGPLSTALGHRQHQGPPIANKTGKAPRDKSLRKRASDDSLQVQSLEAVCRGSLACLLTTPDAKGCPAAAPNLGPNLGSRIGPSAAVKPSHHQSSSAPSR